MRRILVAAAAALAAMGSGTASAAPYIDYRTNVGGTFGNDNPTDTIGRFADTISFATTVERLVTIRLFSSHPDGGIAQNVNFVSNGVLLNATVIPIITRGQVEERSLFNFRLPAGLHTIAINGASQIDGRYVGQLLLSGVPEPATWGMMLLGMGAVGVSLRRRAPARAAFARA